VSEHSVPVSAPPPSKNGLASRRGLLTVLAIAVSLAVLYGIRLFVHGLSHESTDDAFLEGDVIPMGARVPGQVVSVRVQDNAFVKRGDVLVKLDPRDFEVRLEDAHAALAGAIGRARAAHELALFTQAIGDAGISQAVSSVDAARAAIDFARAQVATAKAKLEESRAQVSVADAALDQAKADLVAAEADEVRMSAERTRYEEAISKNIVSRQELERVRAEAASATARLAATRARVVSANAQVIEARASLTTYEEALHQAEAQVAETEAQKGEAEGRLVAARAAPHQLAEMQAQADSAGADLERAKAALHQAELDLSYTTITAPEAGRVTRKSVENGAYVVPGQQLLAIVQEEVWVVANFKETQLQKMGQDERATVRVDAYPDRVLLGHVESVQMGTGARFSLLPPENATGNYVKVVQRLPVKIVLDSPPRDLLLAPGMSVEAEVETR